MNGVNEKSDDKKKILKEVLMQLHAGASPEQVKEKFKKVLENASSEDIAKVEQELVKEGMPREELRNLCDVHLAVLGDQLAKQKMQVSEGHPINILMEEHKILTEHAERLGVLVGMIEEACDVVYVGDLLTEVQTITKDFQDAETHYLREENVLFPTLEKHGITEPPAIMWMEHDRIRQQKKQLRTLVDNWNSMPFTDFKTKLAKIAAPFCEILPSHFYKENNVLFPAAMQVIPNKEWAGIRQEFDKIGYCCFTPQELIGKSTAEKQKLPVFSEGLLQFENGALSKEEIEGILDALPVDVSFVDKNDAVKYFNKAERRIFVRSKAVLGMKVQNCHPQKSIHIVNKIVEAFKTGKKDSAEFWITMNNRFVHIRYFAVKDAEGKYLGTMEVTQDLTDIKKLEGEKRLLDWKD